MIKKYWKIHGVEFIGINVSLSNNNIKMIPNSLVVVSADFSHRLPLQKAIKLASSIKFKKKILKSKFFFGKGNSSEKILRQVLKIKINEQLLRKK